MEGDALMGSSGSGAGGGSGGGSSGFGVGGGGGGGAGGGLGSVTLRGGALTSADPGKEEAWKAIQSVLSRLPRDYLSFLVGDAGVARAYEAMFRLHVLLLQDRSWKKVEQEFGVDGGSGCLVRLADALASDIAPAAVNPALQAPLKAALLDFFQRVVDDDPTIRNHGDAEQVLAHAREDAFARTSNLFLGSFLYENLRLEGKNLNRAARSHLLDFAMAKADQIVSAFEGKFRHKAWKNLPQVSYPHLVKVMGAETDWTAARLRAKVMS